MLKTLCVLFCGLPYPRKMLTKFFTWNFSTRIFLKLWYTLFWNFTWISLFKFFYNSIHFQIITLLHFTGKQGLKHGSIALTNLPCINESSKEVCTCMLINAITFWIIRIHCNSESLLCCLFKNSLIPKQIRILTIPKILARPS